MPLWNDDAKIRQDDLDSRTMNCSTTSERLLSVGGSPWSVFTASASGSQALQSTAFGLQPNSWNEENRLEAIEKRLGAEADWRRTEFTYDGLGRRCQKKTMTWNTGKNEWKSSPLEEDVRYVYDGWNLLAELDKNNAIVSYHTWGLDLSQSLQGAGGIGGLLSMSKGGNTYLYTYDGNGNVKDVLDESGSVVASYSYDPFGRTIKSSGAFADENPWRFSTKLWDDTWGLYYYGYRYYSPELHIFLSKDPIREGGSVNLYGFVQNAPVMRIDYRGLFTIHENKFASASCNAEMTTITFVSMTYKSYSFSETTPGKIELRRQVSTKLTVAGKGPGGSGLQEAEVATTKYPKDWVEKTDGSARVRNGTRCRKGFTCTASCNTECCGEWSEFVYETHVEGKIDSTWAQKGVEPALHYAVASDAPEAQLWKNGKCVLNDDKLQKAQKACEKEAKKTCSTKKHAHIETIVFGQ